MNQFRQERVIISGWKRLTYTIQGREVQIPSNTILDELVHFPKPIFLYHHDLEAFKIPQTYITNSTEIQNLDALKAQKKLILDTNFRLKESINNYELVLFDFYNLAKYRLPSDNSSLKDQELLRSRSNELVDYFNEKWQSPSEYDLAIHQWCVENNTSYEGIIYRQNLIEYCKQILPMSHPNADNENQINRLKAECQFIGIPGLEHSFEVDDTLKTHERQQTKRLRRYHDKLQLLHESLVRRFSEYRAATYYLNQISCDTTTFKDLRSDYFNEGNRIQKGNRKNKRLRTSGELDKRLLSQCFFCYRFHLQELKHPNNTLSRYCENCEKTNWLWEKSLERLHIVQSLVPNVHGF